MRWPGYIVSSCKLARFWASRNTRSPLLSSFPLKGCVFVFLSCCQLVTDSLLKALSWREGLPFLRRDARLPHSQALGSARYHNGEFFVLWEVDAVGSDAPFREVHSVDHELFRERWCVYSRAIERTLLCVLGQPVQRVPLEAMVSLFLILFRTSTSCSAGCTIVFSCQI